MSSEEVYINNIENGIRALKLRSKTPPETKVGFYLNKLKPINPGMYDDLMKKYKKALEEYKKKL